MAFVVPVMEKMNKKEFLDYFSKKYSDEKIPPHFQKEQSKIVIDTFFSSIAESLKIGDKVEIRGLGCFYNKEYKGFGNKKNLSTRKMPFFKMSKVLKKKLSS